MLPGSVSLTSTERYPPRGRAYRTDGCRPFWKAAGGPVRARHASELEREVCGRQPAASLPRLGETPSAGERRHTAAVAPQSLRPDPPGRRPRRRSLARRRSPECVFTLIENGAEQQFVIPGCRSALAFVHVNCWSEYGGTACRRTTVCRADGSSATSTRSTRVRPRVLRTHRPNQESLLRPQGPAFAASSATSGQGSSREERRSTGEILRGFRRKECCRGR